MIIPKWGVTTKPSNQKFIGCNLNKERIKTIELLLRDRMKMKDIAECLGISRSRLSRIMTQAGLKKP